MGTAGIVVQYSTRGREVGGAERQAQANDTTAAKQVPAAIRYYVNSNASTCNLFVNE